MPVRIVPPHSLGRFTYGLLAHTLFCLPHPPALSSLDQLYLPDARLGIGAMRTVHIHAPAPLTPELLQMCAIRILTIFSKDFFKMSNYQYVYIEFL